MIKRILMTVVIISASASSLMADRIYTGSGAVIEGKITRVTSESIEYSGGDGIQGAVPRKDVERIVYDSGKEIVFSDTIYLSDGTAVRCFIISVNESFVEYRPADGAVPFERKELSGVSKIVYRDGKTTSFESQASADLVYFRDGRRFRAKSIRVRPANIEFVDEYGEKKIYGTRLIEKIVYADGRVQKFDSSGKADGDDGSVSDEDFTGIGFIEFELGWNGYSGIGMRLDLRLVGGLSINGGAGQGFWGYRVSGALRYYFNYPYGLALSAGAAYTYGSDDVEMECEVDDGYDTYRENVNFRFHDVLCVNGSVLFSWQVFGTDRFYIETGYSHAVTKEKYSYESESGNPLSGEEKSVTDDTCPGGVIFTIGYAFAL